ncbi:squalene/phytoene synthase family protein [Georgenia sp. TF02-10]|uniref:phytoene/squalene synthase family protein n=1 Tax=Georgenia sp. TF02-10 TaxID=2917725 RepID=UPI001FA7D2EA|nr:squalene/phytoene synthase family protein [Georgenia sp. TF02-10]UNX54839.1 squalene/phytoene synthase family protein [Georgenia sp. TF02-10]
MAAAQPVTPARAVPSRWRSCRARAAAVAPAPTARDRYDDAARASAAVVISAYSTSFGWATRLLREPVRTRVRTIYALVRVADEIVDDPDPGWAPTHRAHLLTVLEEETYQALRTGRSANLVVHAFAQTARGAGIGPDLLTPFFAAMRADLSVTTHDAASLAGYVHGSAEVVGLMCLRVFLDGDPAAYAALAPGAARLGRAFQQVNFLRDLAADHDQLGRTYLPGLGAGPLTDARRDALLDDVDADLAAAAAVIGHLPASSRRAVRAAHDLFAELSRRLRATPAAQIQRSRVRVPDLVKARILLTAAAGGGRW